MHAPFYGVDIINEGVHVFSVSGLILHGNIHNDLVLFPFKSNYILVDQILALIEISDKFSNTAGIMELFTLLRPFPVVGKGDFESLVEECQFSYPDLQCVIAEICAFLKDFRIRHKGNNSAGIVGFPDHGHFFRYCAAGESHFIYLAVSVNLNLHPGRQSINYGNTYPVETAGNCISAIPKLTACMENCQYYFQCRLARFVHVYRNTTAIICYRAAPIWIDGNLNGVTEPGQGFIDTVIYNFINQVMKTAGRRRTDVHARAETNRFQTFQYSYFVSTVISIATFFLMMSLNFMNFFAHIFSPVQ